MASPENNMSIEEFLGSSFHDDMVEGMADVITDFEEGLGKVMSKSLGVFEKTRDFSANAVEEGKKTIARGAAQLNEQISYSRTAIHNGVSRAIDSSTFIAKLNGLMDTTEAVAADQSIGEKLLAPILKEAQTLEDKRTQLTNEILEQGQSLSRQQLTVLNESLIQTEEQFKANAEEQKAIRDRLEKVAQIEGAIKTAAQKREKLLTLSMRMQRELSKEEQSVVREQIEKLEEQTAVQRRLLAIEQSSLKLDVQQDKRQTKFQKLQAIKDRVVESDTGQAISNVASELGLDALMAPLMKIFGPVLKVFTKVQKIIQAIGALISSSAILTAGLVAAFGLAIVRSKNFWKLMKTIGPIVMDMIKGTFKFIVDNWEALTFVIRMQFKAIVFLWQNFERGVDSFFGLLNMAMEQGTGIFDTFNTALHELADFFKFFIWAPIRSMLDNLGEKFPLLQGVISSVTSVIEGLGNQFRLFTNFITESFKLLFEGDIIGVFANLGKYVKDTFSNIINIYKEVFEGIGTTFVDTLKAIVGKIPGLSKVLGISSAQKSTAEEDFDVAAKARKSPIEDQEKLRLAEERIDAFMTRNKMIEEQLAAARDADEKARLEIMATRNRNLIAVQKERISQFQEAEAREKVKQQEPNNVTIQPNNARMESLLAEMSKNVAESNKKDQKIEVRPQYVVSSPAIPSSTSSTLRR
jgi:hypothetical protein